VTAFGVLLGNGDGTFQPQQAFNVGIPQYFLAVSDVNGDSKPDLVTAFGVLLGNGNGTFQAQQTFVAGSSASSVVVSEVNGDNKPDIVNTNSGYNTVSIRLGNGNGTFQPPQSFAAGTSPVCVAMLDVNGDNKPDIATANYASSGTVSVLLNSTSGVFVPAANFDFNAPQQRISLKFGQDVSASLSISDLTLRNLSTAADIPSDNLNLSYDSANNTASFAFPAYAFGALSDGRYRVTLAAASVTNASGQPMNGDLTFEFFVLAGDANHDARVDIADLYTLASNWQGTGKVFSQGDFNYDGKVDAKDLGILSLNWQKNLPAPIAPAQPVALAPAAPKRTATRVAALVL
jgi:hypothetical protein